MESVSTQTDSLSHNRNAARVNRDEAELKALLEQAGVPKDETEEEEVSEAVPDSSQLSDDSVSSEGDTEQKEEPKAEAQEETELSAEEKSFKKRYADIRKYMQDKDAEYKGELEKLKAQLDAATKNELVLPKSQDEIDAWSKKYPDIAGIVEAIADKKANERASDLDVRLKEIEEMRAATKREKAEVELLSLHPDFAEIRATDAFHDWADKQPQVYQDALYENAEDVQSVARVIDMYKADKGIKTKKPSADASAASSVKSRRTTPGTNDSSTFLTESQVDKMSIKEYEKRMDEIREAQLSGKFIYDISKR
jgi:hypothetical protein